MIRSGHLALVILLGWSILLETAFAAGDEPARRPNIVFILADDLRWDALGCAGNSIVQTLHIDKLAQDGVRFRKAFVTTSICAVSRASILSGQYARRHGIHDFATPFTAEQWNRTYPALLRAAGYRTGFIGKYGVGRDVRPMSVEFDYWRGLPGQAGPFFDPKDTTRTHATAKFGDQALEFLRGGEPGRPFCLSISFSAPHARDGQPREFPPDLRDEGLYAGATIPVPPTAHERFHQSLPEFARDLEGRKRWERRFATPEMFQRIVKDYYRLITGVDREVGRIRAVLQELKLADNTLIVFIADNGFFLGDRGMADKWLPYEPSIRVPLIVFDPRGPAAWRGQTTDDMALNIDVAPTLLDLAGLPIPETMQGRSLKPLLLGQQIVWRDDWFYEHLTFPDRIPQTEGVRTSRWKYFRWLAAKEPLEELYDLANDPHEERNLAGEAAHAAQLRQLRERWTMLREQLR